MKKMNYVVTYKNVINKLAVHLTGHIEVEIAKEYFTNLCEDLNEKENLNPTKDHWKESKLRKYLETLERFELISFLEDEFRAANDNFEKKYYYPTLITYLNLTCFDQIGQNDFRTYRNWIRSKRNDKRDEFLNTIDSEDKIEILTKSDDEYIRIHGVKNNFTFFFEEILSPQQLKDLMEHFIITDSYTTVDLNTVVNFEGDLSIKDKINYLYNVRNNYTHSMRSSYATMETFIPSKNQNHVLHDEYYKNKKRYGVIKTSKFSGLLKTYILIGIANVIKKDQGIQNNDR